MLPRVEFKPSVSLPIVKDKKAIEGIQTFVHKVVTSMWASGYDELMQLSLTC